MYPAQILYIVKIFSLSGFKDLFVNENEIQYEISEIKKILIDLDLSFCGFQLNDYQTRILRKEKITDISLKQLSLIEKNTLTFLEECIIFGVKKFLKSKFNFIILC